MIIALDIETIPNADAVALMPEPEVKTGNLKDPDKIAAKIAETKAAQVEKAALDPLFARIVCFSVVGINGAEEVAISPCVDVADDAHEASLLQGLFRVLGGEGTRIVTWNGNGFDLPMIYKRALILGVDPANFGAPALSAWTKRYGNDRHYDLMQIWGEGSLERFSKLDTVARLILGDHKTPDFDVTEIATLIQTQEGRDKVAAYCLQDTRLTWQLFQRMNGFLFN